MNDALRGKGRGVIAGRRFGKDELIERDPVIVIPPEEWVLLQETVLADYCFFWREGADDVAVALGHGSLLNHSYSPNAISVRHLRQRVIDFVALRDIEEGEEITLNYHGDPESQDPVSFDVKD
jgi:SET domain-containing protein